ncbi:hypothetical protein VOLCADRAFT_80622 [Volvox carteri f. nagariensis]|uniref:Secretory carrier-associated membrane protein n=1 Tax=Volvox carteri f. nagariensis TaxID=3068 RepID=D8TSG4_VOLCA|nr:uncharacterized protein VOLCADRAFT_80622 [Volvox carteri f. nagariensis]EFJ49365.1 hypothetical protein VOLCADRAFT_80622 [Volvox carteri f. nagariensis]|eukprot:XP_002949346.1 hypothetical protein VOLCADRAFT_80622 [Volvox carteri f. nagariensis]
MAMGWGAVGGGAWGPPPQRQYEDDANQFPQAPPSPKGAYGASTFSATAAPRQELATTSQRSQPSNNGGFGSAAGAYGQATAGGQQSFGVGSSTQANTSTLNRKEAELAAKEKQLKELEAKLSEQNKKNWPICYPILYHDISAEIPPKGRRVVREGYMAWWGLVICLIWNWFCTCVMLGQNVNQKVPSWFLALVYLITGVPLSWWLWYKRLYNGAKADSAFSFIWFFIWFAVHTAFCTWAAIAFPFSANQWSFAGFITALNALDKNYFAGVVYLVGAGCWTVLAAWSCWVIVDVFLHFRGKGGIRENREEKQKEEALAAFRQGGVVNQV